MLNFSNFPIKIMFPLSQKNWKIFVTAQNWMSSSLDIKNEVRVIGTIPFVPGNPLGT